MRIYSRKNPADFHPNPIWNDGALGFLKRSPQEEEQQDDLDEQRYEISSWSKNYCGTRNICSRYVGPSNAASTWCVQGL